MTSDHRSKLEESLAYLRGLIDDAEARLVDADDALDILNFFMAIKERAAFGVEQCVVAEASEAA